jgi:hypothetical protein
MENPRNISLTELNRGQEGNGIAGHLPDGVGVVPAAVSS